MSETVAARQGVECRLQRVDHRAVAGFRTAMRLHPLQPGAQCGRRAGLALLLLCCGGEQDRQQHAARSAGTPRQDLSECGEQRGIVGERQAVDRGRHRARSLGERRSGVAITDAGVDRVDRGLHLLQQPPGPQDQRPPSGILRRLLRQGVGQDRRRHRPGCGERTGARPGCDLAGCRQRLAPFVREDHHRQREAVHVERRHQRRRADHQLDPLRQRRTPEGVEQQAHLDRGHRTEIVHQQCQPGTPVRQRLLQPPGRMAHQRVGVGHRQRLGARLAVDAETELDLVRPQPRGVVVAAAIGIDVRQREADRGGVGGDRARGHGDLGERAPLLRHQPGDPVHEQRAGQPAWMRLPGQRDVVTDDDGLHGQAETARPLRRQPEIEPVAGVVLDHQQAAGGTGDRQDRRQHGIDRRRGEDVAAHRRTQHAQPDEACVGRFMARAPARHDRDLSAAGIRADVGIGTEHDTGAGAATQARQAGPGRGGEEALDRLVDQGFAAVQEPFHGFTRLLISSPDWRDPELRRRCRWRCGSG